ncbi:class I SAM-dependent methyltransferase [Bradyrhizobium erythrophlei]|uniref:Methyltransferase domain-containing protein n=1 Tax=Bradyrhizobium erythrophlei TaxID=1437360 RepID=A0A1M7UHI0_9BRAD|nr:class I SAM-dependent methyltransferase [Bradyrhizobium erythrophlei]SHN82365.1 Methyltransferase domain-containing protein [Bradyrhizobium erythrophlei]
MQRTTEWLNDDLDYAYHERQFDEPYQSTLAFCAWLEQIGAMKPDAVSRVLDIGCGQGANLFYMQNHFPNATFTGIDLNPNLVARGNAIYERHGLSRARLLSGDLYKLDPEVCRDVDCLVSFQTLSWLPEFKRPLRSFAATRAKWICLSSLFFDGQATCTIEIQEYDENYQEKGKGFCNVYSLPVVEKFLLSLGYGGLQSIPFEITIDLPRPSHKGLGTYTRRTTDGARMQISGPLLMPWYFIAARRLSDTKT